MNRFFQICLLIFVTSSFTANAQSFLKFDGVEGESTADCFLKLGDIKGEATDKKHQGWIEVLSLNISRSNEDTKEFPGDLFILSVNKPYNGTSKQLSGKYEPGSKAKRTVFEVVDKSTRTRIRVRLLKPVILNWKVEEGESVKGKSIPTENITLGYTEVEWTYVRKGDKKKGKGMEQLMGLLQRIEGFNG